MSLYIEVPKDYADAKGSLMQMYTLLDDSKFYVEFAEKARYPLQLLIQSAPTAELDPSQLKPYP